LSRVVIGWTVIIVALLACGGAPGGEATPSEPVNHTFTVKSGEPAAPVALSGGRYRVEWAATNCPEISIKVTQQDGSFVWEKKSTNPKFNALMSSAPAGTYLFEQLNADCAEWSLTINRISN
jgi:hypothetical protein